ncbi:ArnT family glycosyltransferase [Hyphococcus luteus]|uniref:Glycosyltransferase RgtA/B/C/D-like domain-containing protein n=1 Tax=Hyphococcus luteus TaxID=2058213 RepID=A0A2S7K9A7_9PROT|nr:glycosyltransferase family 39 protein [Marinicaulis flavus]PQA89061.1 hypothetical protein CW354_03685 [Marinicaulis flavus]
MPKTAALVAAWNDLSFNRQLAALVALGLALRLVWALLVPVIPQSDSYVYWVTAGNLANDGVYGVRPDQPFSYWPVGTSAVYAAFFKIFGVNMTTAVFVNLAAGALLILTSARLARRWFGEREALWTAAILAVWPSLVMYATILASEVFFILAINTALLAWDARKLPAAGASLLSGVTFALAALIRPLGLLVPVVFAIMKAAKERKIVPQAWRLVVVLIAMFAAIAPWTARNYAVHDAMVLISTNGAPVLWMGNNPETDGGYMPLPDKVIGMNEVERARVLGDEAKAYMMSNPVRTGVGFVKKLINTHLRETIAVHWNQSGIEKRFGAGAVLPLKLLTQAYWMIVFLASLAGVGLVVFMALKEKTLKDKAIALMSPPLGLWAYYACMHAVIVSGDRYHMQSIPFIAMLAGFAVAATFSKLKSKRDVLQTSEAKGA